MNDQPKIESELPWAETKEVTQQRLRTDPESGLSSAEVRSRQEHFGLNALQAPVTHNIWAILLNQVKSLIVALLGAAALLSMLFGEWMEAWAILAVLAINTLIGFVTELKAVRSMEALRRLGTARAVVRRDGQPQVVEAESLVPGDVLLLDAGDSISADLRLVEASKLQGNESALTGESVPVEKHVEPLPPETELMDRENMLFKGTFLTRGTGLGIVTSTGMQTELGKITQLVKEAAGEEQTPLEKRLSQVGRVLVWLAIGMSAVVAVLGILRGKDTYLMIETAVALAVAAIPEGLPIVATIALARGMMRMANRNVLISKLAAVETLGATNVICTDKTGTLTENRMTVTRILYSGGEVKLDADGQFLEVSDEILRQVLETGVLCNNASLSAEATPDEANTTGDPMEVALLVVAARYEITRALLLKQSPEVREVAFDPEAKMMATYHREPEGFHVAVKGAPESILNGCSHLLTSDGVKSMSEDDKHIWLACTDELAALGLRMLAFASKSVKYDQDNPYEDLTFLGLMALEDPPREDVRQAIEACRRAGIRLVMVTGDQPVTARKIAQDVGLITTGNGAVILGSDLEALGADGTKLQKELLKVDVFARVTPKQKLDLIALYKREGAIVAMLGDGVNDAPALEKADIGVAMGMRGTQVAREAADVVLEDDCLGSIVVAVEQGRVIFNNIQKFVVYLLSCNASEVMVVGLASLVNAPLPLLPMQILFLNLVTDVFPALALGMNPGDSAILDQPPRDPKEPILPSRLWLNIAGYALVITGAVLGALAIALNVLELSEAQAVTVSFLTLAFAQLWHVFNMRDPHSKFFRNDVTRNPYIWGALALCVTLILAGVLLPGLSNVLKIADPGAQGWAVALSMSCIPCAVGLAVRVLIPKHSE